jgi:drug/metabolite transporter (DMT)-like permease
MNTASPSDIGFVIGVLLLMGLYVASLVVFAIFVIREEGTGKSKLFAALIILVGIVVVFFNRLLGGGVMVAACFYVADRKNRSRMWALPALFLGPLVLLVLLFLPKLEDASSGLHLTS